jgi:hypothetical protein
MVCMYTHGSVKLIRHRRIGNVVSHVRGNKPKGIELVTIESII